MSNRTTLGVIVGNRGFFPSHLCESGRADVLGQKVTTNQRQRTIVGVMPPRFTVEGLVTNYLMPYGWKIDQMYRSGRSALTGPA